MIALSDEVSLFMYLINHFDASEILSLIDEADGIEYDDALFFPERI